MIQINWDKVHRDVLNLISGIFLLLVILVICFIIGTIWLLMISSIFQLVDNFLQDYISGPPGHFLAVVSVVGLILITPYLFNLFLAILDYIKKEWIINDFGNQNV